jgi:hypothetical protein
MEAATAFFSMFASSAAPVATTTATTAATTGFSLSTLLQGGATVLGAVTALNAGNADAEAAELAADDAAREVPLETLQGLTRRTGIKAEMMQRAGELDTAYAASGTDLSFGTPLQARTEAYREADLGLTSDMGTEQTRVARLREREVNYRKRAKRARAGGWLDALTIGAKGAASISERY